MNTSEEQAIRNKFSSIHDLDDMWEEDWDKFISIVSELMHSSYVSGWVDRNNNKTLQLTKKDIVDKFEIMGDDSLVEIVSNKITPPEKWIGILEVGKRYTLRNGKTTSKIKKHSSNSSWNYYYYAYVDKELYTFTECGRYNRGFESDFDIIDEYRGQEVY